MKNKKFIEHENYDFFYGLEADLEELTETHNYFPGTRRGKKNIYIYIYIYIYLYKSVYL